MLFYLLTLSTLRPSYTSAEGNIPITRSSYPSLVIPQDYTRESRRLQLGYNVTQNYVTVPEAYAFRIQLVYQLAGSSLNTAEVNVLQSQLVPTAVRRVARLLSLKRSVQGNQTLARVCKTQAQWKYGIVGSVVTGTPDVVTCVEYYPSVCGATTIPDYFMRPAKLCTTNGPTDCTNLPSGTGIPNSDTIVFVSSNNSTNCNAFNTVQQTAVGTYCYRDQFDRPIALNLNICPGTLNLATAADLTTARKEDLVGGIIRALLQGLGMDHALLPYFRNADTNVPLVARDANNEPTGSTAAVYFTATAGDGSTPVSKIVTTQALQAARSYLGCNTLDGVETSALRLGGSSLFWSDRIYDGELMAAAAALRKANYVTNLTLALLHDSGWYLPNFALASSFRFAKGATCALTNYQCPATAQADPSTIPAPFCKYNPNNPFAAKRCDNGRQMVLACPSNPGPWDDGCYVQAPLNDAYQCTIPSTQITSTTVRSVRTTLERIGYSYGTNSFCLESSVTSHKLSDSTVQTLTSDGVGCFVGRCSRSTVGGALKTTLEIFVSDPTLTTDVKGNWVVCPYSTTTTQYADLASAGLSSSFTGQIGPCPNPDVVCPMLSCPGNCNGNGVCDDTSICRCKPGWTGADCSLTECAFDSDCNANQACDRANGYCIAAAPPPSPPLGPPPPAAPVFASYTLYGQGFSKGCTAIMDADGDGRQRDPVVDADIVREVAAVTDSQGAFSFAYSSSFLRPGVLPRNLSLITRPGEPQVLVTSSPSCRDQYTGTLQWGSFRSLLVPQIFPYLGPPPVDDVTVIERNNNTDILTNVPVDPLTTLVGEVYLLLIANYSNAGLLGSISRADIMSEASYRVAVALDALLLDPSYNTTAMNSSVLYRELFRNGQPVQVPTDLLDTVQYGRVDLITAVRKGYTVFLKPLIASTAVNSLLSQIAAVVGNTTAATPEAQYAYRAATIALAEEIIVAGDGSLVSGLDEYLLKQVVAAGGWQYVAPGIKLAILIRSARRVDPTDPSLVLRLILRAAQRSVMLHNVTDDADEDRFYFTNTSLTVTDLLKPQYRTSASSSASARRLLQSTPSTDLSAAAALVAPVAASFYSRIQATANLQPAAGTSPVAFSQIVLATLSVIGQASTGTVATYMAQVRGGALSSSDFQASTSSSSVDLLLEARTAPGAQLATEADLQGAISGQSPRSNNKNDSVHVDRVQRLLIQHWWVAAGGLLLLVFLVAVSIWYANVVYRRRYKSSPKEERAERAAEERRKRQQEDLLLDNTTPVKEVSFIPVKPQPKGGPPANGTRLHDASANGQGVSANGNNNAVVAFTPGSQSHAIVPAAANNNASPPATTSTFRGMVEQPSNVQQAERERDLLVAGSLATVTPTRPSVQPPPPPSLPPPPPPQFSQPLVFPAPVASPPPPNASFRESGQTPDYLSSQSSGRGFGGPPPGPPPPYGTGVMGGPIRGGTGTGPLTDTQRSRPPPDDFRVPAPPSLPPPPPPVMGLSTATTVVAATMLKLKSRAAQP